MKCMISGKEFDENKAFPEPEGEEARKAERAFGNPAKRAHAEEASKWHHVQLLVDGKEVASGHIAPDVNPATLTISSSK